MTTKEEYNKWNEKNYPYKIINVKEENPVPNKQNNVMPLLYFLLAVVAIGLLAYAVSGDKFKSDITQNVTLDPEVLVTNQYEFTPKTENNYTFNPQITVQINNVTCPI